MWDEKEKSETKKDEITEDFWSLPVTRTKSYRQPSFEGRTMDTVPIDASADEKQSVGEKIPPRQENAPAARTVRSADRVPTYKTSVYSGDGYQAYGKEHRGWAGGKKADDVDFNDLPVQPKQRSTAGETLAERSGTGWLIKQITIRRWINDFSFYGRFAHDAKISHGKASKPEDGKEPVAFFAYVPQYAQMNSRQLGYYLWFRDQTKSGVYPQVDMAYVVLYVFEILNLPDLIPPAEGIEILCRLWIHYRQIYPRLDSYLGEWVPDYSMIHDVPLPSSLFVILPEIVRKAQFKEFYLDFIKDADKRDIMTLADILIEAYSDYDYRKSRYYNVNKAEYDTEIRNALCHVLVDAWEKKRDIFVLERTYRLTRDAYCGAIAQTDVKRRIDIAFHSCIRPPETRKFVTDIVKYAENRLRLRLRIKSKLGTEGISPADKQLVDEYFGEIPAAEGKRRASTADEPDYLKQYEADSSGFDFASAGAIEAASWSNTERLTEDDTFSVPVMEEYSGADAIMITEEVSGELSTDTAEELLGVFVDTVAAEGAKSVDEPEENTGEYALEKAAVCALLGGNFAAFCRERGLFPGQVADAVNEIFLDRIGDILIEDNGMGKDFHILDDYREEAETWSRT